MYTTENITGLSLNSLIGTLIGSRVVARPGAVAIVTKVVDTELGVVGVVVVVVAGMGTVVDVGAEAAVVADVGAKADESLSSLPWKLLRFSPSCAPSRPPICF